jgi:hypothetical protein
MTVFERKEKKGGSPKKRKEKKSLKFRKSKHKTSNRKQQTTKGR